MQVFGKISWTSLKSHVLSDILSMGICWDRTYDHLTCHYELCKSYWDQAVTRVRFFLLADTFMS